MTVCLLLSLLFGACARQHVLSLPARGSRMGGKEFYSKAAAMSWRQRDSFAIKEILAGNIPAFFGKFTGIRISIRDTISPKKIQAIIYVSPDYLSIGTESDWARIPLTPMAAQFIADTLGCFLPTKKIVDDIYKAAIVKLEPVPMFAYRDSTPTMWQHHLIIEGQRKGKKGLIAGIKKDLVISERISRDHRPNREAIYGWHKPDGKPIQPLYTGHINWWVDYSHGVRLIYRKIKVKSGKGGFRRMNFEELLKDPVLKRLICDEEYCDFYRYNY
ncbi:MAG TPA: hypothetical protein VFX58_08290 [Chitinophagaceae bacterium]|nr:hypothetical protein [Chitinophagaceae bacterium]